jgi:hypothetical protein
MSNDNKMTFNEYWEQIKPDKIAYDVRSQEEIMSDVLEIEKKFRKEE